MGRPNQEGGKRSKTGTYASGGTISRPIGFMTDKQDSAKPLLLRDNSSVLKEPHPYDIEPLPGKFPLPGVGPFSLLQETKMNHYGKIMFRWMYWNLLIRGLEMPMESRMSMAGKR